MKPSNVLILPGWQASGPEHWQSRWERAHGYSRVEQHNWLRPLRGDWIARLEETLLACDEPAVLVAHGLACVQVAAWASRSRNTHAVKAAMLVAPLDVETDNLRQRLPGWAPVLLPKLPFKTLLWASSNDPLCEPARAQHWASAWGAECCDAGPCGHINADSGLGDWPQAHAQLMKCMAL